MGKLKGRRERFARGIADGLTQGQAARRAGYKSSAATRAGSKLAHIPEVRARVEELRQLKPLIAEDELLDEFAESSKQDVQVRPVLDPDGYTRAILVYLPVAID